ncbi:MAG: head-tail connector protein [Pseudomonadota bacterium]
MMLIEQSAVPSGSLPIAELREHLRLGTGFSDDAGQDSLLEDLLRAALAAVEQRTTKAVLQRSFRWTLAAWRGLDAEVLPVAPVWAVTAVRVLDADGGETEIAHTAYGLQLDAHRPCLVSRSYALPTVPVGGSVEIDFDAGYGADWAAVPQDLGRAVLLLAAHYHEHRHAVGDRTYRVPEGVTALLAPYRNLRLFGARG